MYFLFSGEGATDFGTGEIDDDVSEGPNYNCGPMACIVDQLIEHVQHYSIVENECCGFVSKQALISRVKGAKGRMLLPRAKVDREVRYFYRHARALAQWAKEVAAKRNDNVVAILFRDCDGTHSFRRGLWEKKLESIVNGFEDESFDKGVPMVPKPKSESWVICAMKRQPYKNCTVLEDRIASEKAKLGPKKELRQILDSDPSREHLCALVREKTIDANQICMPSFNAFKDRLFLII